MLKKRILVVDDEELMRLVLHRKLTREGHEVAEAENGEEALRLLRAESFDLVVTDIVMPVTDGLELIRRIQVEWPGTKVVAMSAHGERLVETASRLGVSRAVAKPFELCEFVDTVREILSSGAVSAPS